MVATGLSYNCAMPSKNESALMIGLVCSNKLWAQAWGSSESKERMNLTLTVSIEKVLGCGAKYRRQVFLKALNFFQSPESHSGVSTHGSGGGTNIVCVEAVHSGVEVVEAELAAEGS